MRRLLLLGLLAFGLSVAGQAGKGVSWQAWAPGSFAQARAEGRLVLVDAEANWCHWCHEMDRRTYADENVARLLRQGYVAIRADIDRHPDARERYEDIGWPGTAIYGPDGAELYRHQGFMEPETLRSVLAGFLEDQRRGALKPLESVPAPKKASEAWDLGAARTFALQEMDGYFDPDFGGWGEQKYPVAMNVEASFREAFGRRDAGWKLRALFTLAQQRQITDPVWGGLFQYSVGPDWHRVHFEKLGHLQALYLENLAEAYRATGDEDWLRDARAVVGFLRRFLRHPEGGFSATVDAEPPGLEGRAFYALDAATRAGRTPPPINTHRYPKENGLFMAAFAALYRAEPDPSLLQEARAALAYADAHLFKAGGYLHEEEQPGAWFLADQAAMLKGLLALHEVTGDATLLTQAEALAAYLQREFATKELCRARTRSTETSGLFGEDRFPFEENALLARSLLRLHAVTGATAPKTQAECILQALSQRERLEVQGRWLGDFVLGISELLETAPHLAVVGPVGESGTEALFLAALKAWRPGLVVIRHDPAQGAPRNPDLGFPALKGAAAFLCGGGSCSSPLRTEPALEAAILGRRAVPAN